MIVKMLKKTIENVLTVILILLVTAMLPLTAKNSVLFFNKQTAKNVSVKPNIVNKYFINIDVDENMIYLLKNGKCFKSYVCASGKNTTPSPLGYFKIVKKSLWGEGFGGYYMGLNCPWGDYGIHGTTSPDSIGFDASHGCFRMYNSDVEELYSFVAVGTPVIISEGSYGDFGCGMRTIGHGMYGQDVLAVQKKLMLLGFFKGNCDGIFDTYDLLSAIHQFQKAKGLPICDYINKSLYSKLGFAQIE
jgi:hypothetical protein